MPAQKGYRSPPSDGSGDGSRDSRDSRDSRVRVPRDQSSSTQNSKRSQPKPVVIHQQKGEKNDDVGRDKYQDSKKWR